MSKSTATSVIAPALPKGVHLTAEGRTLLRERIDYLRTDVLDVLRPHLMGPDRDERDVAHFERTLAEVDRLEGVLAAAGVLAAHATGRRAKVAPGALVEIETPGGLPERVRVRLVHPEEAAFDDERISWNSPLAQALLGATVGETREVQSPRGTWTCVVRRILA